MNYTYSFEKLEIWHLSVELAEKIYQLTATFPENEKYGLVSQMRRAIVSVSSNLAEGSARISAKDQARFSQLAFSSLMEVTSQLYLSNRLGVISADDLDKLRPFLLELSNKINKYRKSQLARVKENSIAYGNQLMTETEILISEEPENYSLNMKQINKSTNQQINTPDQQINKPMNQLIEQDGYHFHSSAIIDQGAKVGQNTKIWHFSHVMGKAVIGANCSLGQNVFVANNVILGDKVKVQNNVSLYDGVICEDEVFLGPSVVLTNVINPRSGVERKDQYKKTLIGKGATLGANATIVCGNRVGKYAFIGAGATVTKDVPDFALVVGNPARQIGWMSQYGHRLNFDEKGMATCPESGEQYQLKDELVIRLKTP